MTLRGNTLEADQVEESREEETALASITAVVFSQLA